MSRQGQLRHIEIPVGNGREPLRLQATGAEDANPGDRLVLSLRPEDVSLHISEPEGINVIEGEIIDSIYLGSFLEGRVRVGIHEVGIQMNHYEDLVPGQKVYLSFTPEHGLCLTD